MNNKPHKLALFGNPVNHSLSPQIHQHFAKQFGLNIDYELIQVTEVDFPESVKHFFNSGGVGANVTLPHKSLALSVVEKINKKAKSAKAINTLYRNKKSVLCGDNTDGKGFVKDIRNRLNFNFKNRSVLILGAGGATQGLMPALLMQKPKLVMIANRSLEKAQNICTFKNTQATSIEQLKAIKQKFDFVIHASSLGHQGQTLTFHSHHVHDQTIGYDLSYGKAALPFLELCQSYNLNKFSDGLGMLVEQAAYSFERWFDHKPSTDSIYQLLSENY